MEMQPWLRWWFNQTAGLEKAIIAIAAAFQTYVATIETWSEPMRALVVALIGVVQIIYTANTAPVPPADGK